ncbi:MAG: sigma 54-interacting transcriptional regulator [Clostridia bacterium]|nr:sigma 54-interacting transcriptional regulator [Clostridia bacterium]
MDNKNEFDSVDFLEELVKKIENNIWKCENADAVKESIQSVLDEIKMYQNKSLDFEEIGSHLYDGIYISDGEGKTLYVNKAYTRITGIKAEEVVGRRVDDIAEEGRLYKNPVTMEVIKLKKRVNSVGISLKNGKKMLVTGNPIFDENGNVKKVVTNNREMTDLLKIREELEASIEKLKEAKQEKEKTEQEVAHLRKLHMRNSGIIGKSQEINNVVNMIRQVEKVDATVLITGETGVGKEVVANEIYINSNRNGMPFIKVNCASIPLNLLESELFGYEKGAFTGAKESGKAGMFELANKGMILLDEIGEMPMELQSKFLRVIQQREVVRVGGTKAIELDVRILAATNKNLKEQVALKKFREDLYYRLNVIPIHVPPLRSRKEDIEPLIMHFLEKFNKRYSKEVAISSNGTEILKTYPWPGNIRELQNIIERVVVTTENNAFANEKKLANMLSLDADDIGDITSQNKSYKEMIESVEKRIIEQALKEYSTTRKAASILKLDQSTIVKKAKKLGIKIGR